MEVNLPKLFFKVPLPHLVVFPLVENEYVYFTLSQNFAITYLPWRRSEKIWNQINWSLNTSPMTYYGHCFPYLGVHTLTVLRSNSGTCLLGLFWGAGEIRHVKCWHYSLAFSKCSINVCYYRHHYHHHRHHLHCYCHSLPTLGSSLFFLPVCFSNSVSGPWDP